MIPGPPPRFTLDGSDALESHLADVCDQIHLGLSTVIPPSRLHAILVGGGYGRGEGAVLRGPDLSDDAPHGEFEVWVFIHGGGPGAGHRFRRALEALARKLAPKTGLDVVFQVLQLPRLRRSPITIDYHDLVDGHRWIVGDDDLFQGCDHHRDPSRIPIHEATRRLMKGCTGLLFAAERLARAQFAQADAEFVARHIARARMTFGQAYLAAHGQYHGSCVERQRRLESLVGPLSAPDSDTPTPDPTPASASASDSTELVPAELARLHAIGVASQLHPTQVVHSRSSLVAEHAEITRIGHALWLWLENRRLNRRFASAGEYARSPANKCPETSGLRNRLVNFGSFGLRTPTGPQGSRHPRERLLHGLPLLLWEFPKSPTPPDLRRRLQAELMARASNYPGWIAAYRRLWNRFG